MAAPVTHVVIADILHNKYFNDKERKEFFVGTNFPDIRYLGAIAREKTHFSDVTLADIQKSQSFKAGLLVHSLVDQVRENFVVENKIYDKLPESKFVFSALKIYEDKLLRDKYNNWEEIYTFFEKPLKEELEYEIPEEYINKWHKAILSSLKSEQSDQDINEFVKLINRPKEMADEIIELITVMEKTPAIKEYVFQMYDMFTNIDL